MLRESGALPLSQLPLVGARGRLLARLHVASAVAALHPPLAVAGDCARCARLAAAQVIFMDEIDALLLSRESSAEDSATATMRAFQTVRCARAVQQDNDRATVRRTTGGRRPVQPAARRDRTMRACGASRIAGAGRLQRTRAGGRLAASATTLRFATACARWADSGRWAAAGGGMVLEQRPHDMHSNVEHAQRVRTTCNAAASAAGCWLFASPQRVVGGDDGVGRADDAE